MDVGALRHRVTVQNPGLPVSDGDAGTTTPWPPAGGETLSSNRPAAVKPATARDLERSAAGTVQSLASHLVTMRYLNGVTTQSRVIFHDPVKGDRTFAVTGVHDPEERHVELILACVEVVQ